MKKIVSVLMLVILTGCAHNYSKEGGTKQEFYQTKTQCLVSANQAGYSGGNIAATIARNKFFKECMASEGWVKN